MDELYAVVVRNGSVIERVVVFASAGESRGYAAEWNALHPCGDSSAVVALSTKLGGNLKRQS